MINPILLGRKDKLTFPASHTWSAWDLVPSVLHFLIARDQIPQHLSSIVCSWFFAYLLVLQEPFDALCLTPTPGLPCAYCPKGFEQIFVRWVLLQQKFWHQAGELNKILCEVLPDLKLLDSVCLHGKVRFPFGIKIPGYHLGPVVAYFPAAWYISTQNLLSICRMLFYLVYMCR